MRRYIHINVFTNFYLSYRYVHLHIMHLLCSLYSHHIFIIHILHVYVLLSRVDCSHCYYIFMIIFTDISYLNSNHIPQLFTVIIVSDINSHLLNIYHYSRIYHIYAFIMFHHLFIIFTIQYIHSFFYSLQ